MSKDLLNFKHMSARKVVYALSLLRNIEPWIIVQPDNEYLLDTIKRLSLNESELKTLENIIVGQLLSDTILNHFNSLGLKLFAWYRLHYTSAFTGALVQPYNRKLMDFFDDLVLLVDLTNYLSEKCTFELSWISTQFPHQQTTGFNTINPFTQNIPPNFLTKAPANTPLNPQNQQQQSFSNISFPSPSHIDSTFNTNYSVVNTQTPESLYPFETYCDYNFNQNEDQLKKSEQSMATFAAPHNSEPHANQHETIDKSPKEPNRFEFIYSQIATNNSLDTKLKFYQKVQEDYATSRSITYSLGWLNRTDESQLLWAESYLNKYGIVIYPPSFIPQNNDERYEAIVNALAFRSLQMRTFLNNSHFDTFIRSMRQAAYQKRYRDNKDSESALQYLLAKRYLNKIDKLANKYNAKPLEVLQMLIDSEYERL